MTEEGAGGSGGLGLSAYEGINDYRNFNLSAQYDMMSNDSKDPLNESTRVYEAFIETPSTRQPINTRSFRQNKRTLKLPKFNFNLDQVPPQTGQSDLSIHLKDSVGSREALPLHY